MPKYDSYCGLYCGACIILVANQRNEVEKYADKWTMKAEDIRCNGCKTEVKSVYCQNCDIRKCAESKGIEFCFECDEFPCEMLQNFVRDFAHHRPALINLKSIKQNGLDQWLTDQKDRWSCPNCGTPFTWYDSTCRNCGESLYDSKAEEADLNSE